LEADKRLLEVRAQIEQARSKHSDLDRKDTLSESQKLSKFIDIIAEKLLDSLSKANLPEDNESRMCFCIFKRRKSIMERVLSLNVAYDSEEDTEWQMVRMVWKTLVGEDSRVSKIDQRWQTIGFQRTDPRTDINRSQGLINLFLLLNLVLGSPEFARLLFEESNSTTSHFPLACVSINFGVVAIEAFRKGYISRELAYRKEEEQERRDTSSDRAGSTGIQSTSLIEISVSLRLIAILHVALMREFINVWKNKALTIEDYGGLLAELKSQCQSRRGVHRLVTKKNENVEKAESKKLKEDDSVELRAIN